MTISRWSLIWPLLLTIILPLIVAFFVYPNHLPPSFGVFPPVQVSPTPGFNWIYFTILSIGALVVTLFILFPRLFGFKKVTTTATPVTNKKFPWWFYLGAVLMVFFWWLMWSRSFIFGDLIYYAFTPMWWGFILFLDGIVYFRTGGKSLVANRKSLMVISSVFSIFGWGYFEYFDYFVQSNWYYPNGHMDELPHSLIVALFLIAYTTVWPAIFVWYTLLETFPKLVARYSDGFKLKLNGTFLIVLGSVVLAGMAALPHLMFWGIWIGAMSIFTGQLIRLGVWTPYLELKTGNWSPAILIALASFFTGILWEMWNYGSANPNPVPATNPNYWIYDIPYVNIIHIFSEMPLLGYYGYLPFGLLVWVLYIWGGKLFGFKTDLKL